MISTTRPSKQSQQISVWYLDAKTLRLRLMYRTLGTSSSLIPREDLAEHVLQHFSRLCTGVIAKETFPNWVGLISYAPCVQISWRKVRTCFSPGFCSTVVYMIVCKYILLATMFSKDRCLHLPTLFEVMNEPAHPQHTLRFLTLKFYLSDAC